MTDERQFEKDLAFIKAVRHAIEDGWQRPVADGIKMIPGLQDTPQFFIKYRLSLWKVSLERIE